MPKAKNVAIADISTPPDSMSPQLRSWKRWL